MTSMTEMFNDSKWLEIASQFTDDETLVERFKIQMKSLTGIFNPFPFVDYASIYIILENVKNANITELHPILAEGITYLLFTEYSLKIIKTDQTAEKIKLFFEAEDDLTFGHFDNRLPLMEIIEDNFPISHIIRAIKRRTENKYFYTTVVSRSISRNQLFAHLLEEINNTYKSNSEGPYRDAFHLKTIERNPRLRYLYIPFILWKQKAAPSFARSFELAYEIKGKKITSRQLEKLLEKKYIECLARGYNDCRMKERLECGIKF